MGFSFAGESYSTIGQAHAAHRKTIAEEARQGRERAEAAAAQHAAKIQAKRMDLADKITLAIVDQISAAIIRPGPKPEERECYVMAQELRDFSPNLTALVADILKVEAEEK